MMQVIRMVLRGAVPILAAAALAACDNEIPTATGSDLFPGGAVPTTLLVEFTGSDLLLREDVLPGFGDPRRAPFMIVANRFDDVFNAHPLADFPGLPDTVSYSVEGTTRKEEITGFAGGRVMVHVDSLASFPPSNVALMLWELTQPWDSATVSWQNAVDKPGEQVPWTTPGGARGNLLATAFWVAGDTAQKDTVTWQLDSLSVARIHAEDHPGVMITADQPGVRLKLTGLSLAADAHPAGKPDTTIEVSTSLGVESFIFDPQAPRSTEVLVTGGLTGDRSILTLDLERTVESCSESGDCALVPLSEVTLNRAQLVFEPVYVPNGHRPLSTPRVQLRRVAEPELGRYAPLGAVVSSDTILPSAFGTGVERTFELDVTSAVLGALAADSTATTVAELSVALLADFEVPDLALLWFRRSPRLRLVYTLPINPTLP